MGSQLLYGPEVLETVEKRAEEMAHELDQVLPFSFVYKLTAKSDREISELVKEANYNNNCAGIITWCHTFSPSKMWIEGLKNLQKLWCHLATQYNKEIPNDEIDMDFMNLNQAADKPRIETHPLGIGMNEKDPARLVFEGKAGNAVVASLIDMGGRFRLIVQDIECVKPIMSMPHLPVARVMWRAMPDLTTGLECWITAGGAHHTVLSYDVSAEQLRIWAGMMDIEFVHIDRNSTPEKLEDELLIKDLVWRLK